MSLASAGDHVLLPDSIYHPGRHFADTVLTRMGVEISYYAPTIGDAVAELMKPNTRVVYVESPGSNTMEMQDIPAIAAVAHQRNALVVADNTWATPIYCRPLDLGADVAVLSATKYIGGHSDLMMGTVSARGEVLSAGLLQEEPSERVAPAGVLPARPRRGLEPHVAGAVRVAPQGGLHGGQVMGRPEARVAVQREPRRVGEQTPQGHPSGVELGGGQDPALRLDRRVESERPVLIDHQHEATAVLRLSARRDQRGCAESEPGKPIGPAWTLGMHRFRSCLAVAFARRLVRGE